jgi:cation:H+ antiporter
MWIGLAVAVGVPGLVLRVLEATGASDLGHEFPLLAAAVFGVGIMGAAFLLSWAAEAAQKDVSASLAIAVLALIALLPEYAVEFVLAWAAGAHPDDSQVVGRVAANVTGANRLLIGLGWSMVVLLFWAKARKGLALPKGMSLELAMLTLATLVSFLLFFMEEVALPVAAVLFFLYLFYLVSSSRAQVEEPELGGPSDTVGRLSRRRRRLVVALLFLYSAGIIIAAVEPFVDGLVETGLEFGIDEFHLIQWVAPLATESPEIVVALLYTLRVNPMAGMTVLLAAAVNQLTVLIGSMPLVFSASLGKAQGFPLAETQDVEFLLTSAFSLFAVVLLARMRVGWQGALLLLTLFIGQLLFPEPEARRIFAFICLGLAAALLLRDPGRMLALARMVGQEVLEVRGWFSKARAASAAENAGPPEARHHG